MTAPTRPTEHNHGTVAHGAADSTSGAPTCAAGWSPRSAPTLHRPTPCGNWDVRTVLNHVVG